MTEEWLKLVEQRAVDAAAGTDLVADWQQEYADDVPLLTHEIRHLRGLLAECRNFVFKEYIQAAFPGGHEFDADQFERNDPEASHADALAVLRRLEADIQGRKSVAFALWEKVARVVGGPIGSGE